MGDVSVVCKKCGNDFSAVELAKNKYICPKYGYYFKISARERISIVVDKNSFLEYNSLPIEEDLREAG